MPKWPVPALIVAVALSVVAAAAAEDAPTKTLDAELQRAEAFVAQSDRYLHQDKLRPGMKGYGLTVMSAAKVERFQVTVISVLKNWYPHQDIILCKLAGLGLEKTGIISGMSGSPVYVTDPADGKDKMIGAVAYGWSFAKEPICGVQPITQMLAIAGAPLPGRKPPAKASASRRAPPEAALDEEFVELALTTRKVNFAELVRPGVAAGADRGAPGRNVRLVPLRTPVMISGVTDRTLRRAEKLFADSGLLCVRAGTLSAGQAASAAQAKLAPGMALSVPLVTGDFDWAAIGTVTELIGDYVLSFGHALNAEGPVTLPMGPAYVHAVVPSVMSSFKLGSTLRITGALTDDEYTACGGRVGQEVEMIPMVVSTRWGESEQKYRYNLVRHRRMTPRLAYLLLAESVYANRDLPRRHSIRYKIDIDFGELGVYHVENLSSFSGIYDIASDLDRPVWALLNTELGQPLAPKRIEVSLEITPVQKTADILTLKLDRNSYRPGQTVRGQVTLRPFRSDRITRQVSIDLPKDLPDGSYTLTVCDAYDMIDTLRSDMPHRFKARTVPQLYEAIQRVVQPRMDRLYVHFALPGGGLAVRKNELERLPAGLAEILARAAPIDSNRYKRRQRRDFAADYAVSGSADAAFEVRRRPLRNH